MADPIRTVCPACGTNYQIPAHLAGKTVRCKACQAAMPVPAAGASPPSPKAPRAKPAKPKPADAPIGFAAEPPPEPAGDEDDDNPYGTVKDELDVPRCPFCAVELDPPDTKICLNCGYDLMERKRHESKKVYTTSTGEYLVHWLPAIVWLVVAGVALTASILVKINVYSWLDDTFLQTDEKNFGTQQKGWLIDPLCCIIFVWTISAFLIFQGVRFAVKRLYFNWKPQETIKKA